ncbi:hypothetical protein BJ508DRAFT_373845 [Ascobolus immersus RN42]|uniref:Uncharacterized protein n=1 Tax=Ascobolus immersus RN42 TaxID=1160509 RepID=A0A3N4IKA9_ASCIM|nr:hypothetical protein BJ508DRAFT_373845 [Ascobolus immersus RN42]
MYPTCLESSILAQAKYLTQNKTSSGHQPYGTIATIWAKHLPKPWTMEFAKLCIPAERASRTEVAEFDPETDMDIDSIVPRGPDEVDDLGGTQAEDAEKSDKSTSQVCENTEMDTGIEILEAPSLPNDPVDEGKNLQAEQKTATAGKKPKIISPKPAQDIYTLYTTHIRTLIHRILSYFHSCGYVHFPSKRPSTTCSTYQEFYNVIFQLWFRHRGDWVELSCVHGLGETGDISMEIVRMAEDKQIDNGEETWEPVPARNELPLDTLLEPTQDALPATLPCPSSFDDEDWEQLQPAFEERRTPQRFYSQPHRALLVSPSNLYTLEEEDEEQEELPKSTALSNSPRAIFTPQEEDEEDIFPMHPTNLYTLDEEPESESEEEFPMRPSAISAAKPFELQASYPERPSCPVGSYDVENDPSEVDFLSGPGPEMQRDNVVGLESWDSDSDEISLKEPLGASTPPPEYLRNVTRPCISMDGINALLAETFGTGDQYDDWDDEVEASQHDSDSSYDWAFTEETDEERKLSELQEIKENWTAKRLNFYRKIPQLATLEEEEEDVLEGRQTTASPTRESTPLFETRPSSSIADYYKDGTDTDDSSEDETGNKLPPGTEVPCITVGGIRHEDPSLLAPDNDNIPAIIVTPPPSPHEYSIPTPTPTDIYFTLHLNYTHRYAFPTGKKAEDLWSDYKKRIVHRVVSWICTAGWKAPFPSTKPAGYCLVYKVFQFYFKRLVRDQYHGTVYLELDDHCEIPPMEPKYDSSGRPLNDNVLAESYIEEARGNEVLEKYRLARKEVALEYKALAELSLLEHAVGSCDCGACDAVRDWVGDGKKWADGRVSVKQLEEFLE